MIGRDPKNDHRIQPLLQALISFPQNYPWSAQTFPAWETQRGPTPILYRSNFYAFLGVLGLNRFPSGKDNV